MWKIRSALFQVPATRLVEEFRAALTSHFGVLGVEVLLADYRNTTLRPVDSPVPKPATVPVDGSAQGRVFAAQEPLRPSPDRLLLPLTSRGSRLGVVELRLPPGADPQPIDDLIAAIGVCAEALELADRETDHFTRARRHRRMTVAAEIQWDLLPPTSFARDEFALAARLEPAYAVNGDCFDWSADGDLLTVTVTNGMGHGVPAALLTALTLGALRNARRSGADLSEQAGQANDAVHARYGGKEFTETLLLEIDMRSGVLRAVDAGSPLLLHYPADADRRPGVLAERMTLAQQLPLGMFPGTAYAVQEFRLRRGDRLVAISDGLNTATSPAGERFGERMLDRVLRATRRLSAAETVRSLIRELVTYHASDDLSDDAVAICVDWTGA
ncbi:phosphatase [Actinomadura craniellae]|uniref:Phosphatase n=1 Tax=Actinomadura craniellae TaxID=2231787 RepID=A0A365GZU2_9ACTN|nr:phosphatase [Actinomadura craniellae]